MDEINGLLPSLCILLLAIAGVYKTAALRRLQRQVAALEARISGAKP
jgi:hypothetical protein